MFVKLHAVHNFSTKGSEYNFYLSCCIVSSRQSFIAYIGPQLWNALPLNIKMCKSVYIFKK